MRLLTAAEVAEMLRVSTEYVRRLCATGQLPAKKLGKAWRIREEAVEEFMRADEVPESSRAGPYLTKKQRIAVEQRRRQAGYPPVR